MRDIPDGSIDCIITDPPYGTTACKWDTVIPFEPMWERIIKPNGAIVLFGSEPFSSALRMSNIKQYKYDWIWKKNAGSNFAQTKYQPMKEHEIISIFSY
jgi:site-specific DNA-methyltransferase (adenine-specific)